MKYFYVPNLRSRDITIVSDISQVKSPSTVPSGKKSRVREWSAEATTNHVFYSAIEGNTPRVRISQDNPPRVVYGMVGDYDLPSTPDQIKHNVKKQKVPPTWVSTTNSGFVRCVWEFEKPIPTSEHLYPPFAEEMCKSLGMDKVFAGFDQSSLRYSQYFELGSDWEKVGDQVPPEITQTAVVKSVSKARQVSTEVAIPIDVVAAEVETKFPNRWTNPFEVGQRGPLFWIDDGIDRDGCQITEDGIVCYSDRAGKGFLTWGEILGHDFVKEYETAKIGKVLDDYWYDGRNYYTLLNDRVIDIDREQIILELKSAGFSLKKQRGKNTSEVEDAILSIRTVNRVNAAAPIIFSNDRIVDFNSHRILNTGKIDVVQPDHDGDPANWPFLHRWLNQLFEDTGPTRTLDYFYAWLQRFYRSALTKQVTQGQAMLLVGPTGKGKSLLSNRVISGLVGGFSDASDYLSGLTLFNKDLVRVAAWVVDDTTSAATFQDQLKATELIKRAVANPRVEYMAKYADATALPWAGRVIMSLNMDANSLSVIPALDSSNRDKIMALLISENATGTFPDNVTVEQTIDQELPHFARWLLDYDPPAEVMNKTQGRFGVVSYINETIADAAYDNSSRSSVAELVDWFAKKSRAVLQTTEWRGTLTEFLIILTQLNEGRHVGRSNQAEFVRRGMSSMEESSKSSASVRPVRSEGSGGGKVWIINIEDKYDIENLGKTPVNPF